MANENSNPAVDPAAAKAPKGAIKPPAKGDTVYVVGASGGLFPAKVTAASGDHVDVEFAFRDATMAMTSVPYDAEGKRPDSWTRM